jgi:hypothetical protein
MLCSIAIADFGENVANSGCLSLPCSGGSMQIGTGAGMRSSIGSSAIISSKAAGEKCSLENELKSRSASDAALCDWNIQWPPLNGVQKIGGALATRSAARACGSRQYSASLL